MAITNIFLGGYIRRIITVEIQAGASVSDLFQVPMGMSIVGIMPPAEWDAADIAFKAATSEDGAIAGPVRGVAGAAYLKCAVIGGLPIAHPATNTIHWPYVQFLSCTAGSATDVTPVNQTAKRIITVIIERYLS